MIKVPIHVIDFEGSRQSGIVEYGVVTLLGSKITATHTRLCAPVGTISDQDRVYHGISEEIVAEEAPFEADWLYFADLRAEGPFCAHSASVEDGLLSSVWACPRNSPNFAQEGEHSANWGPWLDTLYLYRRIYPKLSSYKLSDLVATFDQQAELDVLAKSCCSAERMRYHCALYDALASALLLKRIYEDPELSTVSLHWLFSQSASTDAMRDGREQLKLF